MKRIILTILTGIILFPLFASDTLSFDFTWETGFLSVIDHKIQSGPDNDRGDVFDYRSQGNQDILFPYNRFQGELTLDQKHHVLLLYQPLTLITTAPITADFRYQAVDFTTADKYVDLTYGFDFWRASYLYDLIRPPEYFLSLGLSMQIRNASIIFQTGENGKTTVNDNVGPVPILKIRTGFEGKNGTFLLFEGDGFYASSAFFNGSGYSFTGYIYDLSLRAGHRFRDDFTVYLNNRFLGGGGEGTNDQGQYTFNGLHTYALSLGGVWSL